jgi:hypothetical protein
VTRPSARDIETVRWVWLQPVDLQL